jgi:aldose 1-epimerase
VTAPGRDGGGAFRPIVLRNRAGLEAWVIPFGATLVRMLAPDRGGRPGDVTLALEDPADYASAHPYLGSTVGRYANRIGGARFVIDGRTVRLAANDGRHHLHGGRTGLSRVVWQAEPLPDGTGVRLRHRSPDGDDGYPGNLDLEVVYRLGDDDALRYEVRATTDAPTVVSIANHAYWNLEDAGASPVLDHTLLLAASRYAPVDPTGLPTGALLPVRDTPFDFTTSRRLGDRIAALVPSRGGYDHPFALDGGSAPRLAARLAAPRSGRVLEIHTTQPALQLYTANFLGGDLRCRGGVRPERWSAVCLETQAFPNAPNEPAFPSARLDPGQVYAQTSVYAFSVGSR